MISFGNILCGGYCSDIQWQYLSPLHPRPACAQEPAFNIKDKICRRFNWEIYTKNEPPFYLEFSFGCSFFFLQFYPQQNFWMFIKMHFHIKSSSVLISPKWDSELGYIDLLLNINIILCFHQKQTLRENETIFFFL